MGVEDRDWHRKTPRPQQQVRPIVWLVGALVLAAALFAASPPGHRLLHLPGPRLPGEQGVAGAPALTLRQAPLYPPGDQWRSYLADERTCPGGERTDLSAQQQVEVMLCLIDWARGEAGLPEPMPTALLTSTALQKGQEIVRCQNFAHAACGGDPAEDVRRADYHGSWGENLYIADGRFGAPRVALDAWLNSPEHRKNLFRAEWRTQGLVLLKISRFGPYHGAELWISQFGSE
jgi:hypothetical protein